MEHKRKAFHLNAFRVIFVYSGDKLRATSDDGKLFVVSPEHELPSGSVVS